MRIVNSLTGDIYLDSVGTKEEKNYFRVANCHDPQEVDKMFFLNKGEYRIHRALRENPKLAQYKHIMINRVNHINNNWEEFEKWVVSPGGSSFKLE